MKFQESFGIGGSEQIIQLRAENINKDFFDVFLAGFYSGGPRLENIKGLNIPSAICNGDLNTVIKIIRDYKPHIISYYRGSVSTPLTGLIQEISFGNRVPLLIETNHFGRIQTELSKRKPNTTVHVSLSSLLKVCSVIKQKNCRTIKY